jgi:hypothetical protein
MSDSLKQNGKLYNNTLIYKATIYKYKIHFKSMKITYMVIDLTWKQKIIIKWLLDGTITNISE